MSTISSFLYYTVGLGFLSKIKLLLAVLCFLVLAYVLTSEHYINGLYCLPAAAYVFARLSARIADEKALIRKAEAEQQATQHAIEKVEQHLDRRNRRIFVPPPIKGQGR